MAGGYGAPAPSVFVVAASPDVDLSPWRADLLEASLVVAADGGGAALLALGRRPDLVVGDGDSWFEVQGATAGRGPDLVWERHPMDKDASDLELALLRADREAPPGAALVVLGAHGGRMDHALANLCLLAHPALTHRRVCLAAEGQRAWTLGGPESLRLEGRSGDLVSLLPLGDGTRVLATEGLRWPLTNAELPFGTTLGLSNRMTGPLARVDLAAGRLACIHTVSGA